VWLRWNDADVNRINDGSLHGRGAQPLFIDLPNTSYSHLQYDAVMDGDAMIGFSMFGGCTANIGGNVSLSVIDEAHAIDGKAVSIISGGPSGENPRQNLDPHVQAVIRATISTKSPVL
jgi:hypothetical protein